MKNTHRHLLVAGSALCLGALLMALGSSWRLSGLSPILVGLATVVLVVGFFALVARAGSQGDVFRDRTWAWATAVTLAIGLVVAALVLPGVSADSSPTPLLSVLVLVADVLIAVGAVALGVQFWNARQVPSRYRLVIGCSAIGVAVVTVLWLILSSAGLRDDTLLLVGSVDFLVQTLALGVVGLTIARLADLKRDEKPDGEPIYASQSSKIAERP